MIDFYLGNELIALGAIEAGASSAYAYPGTPSSEILSAFQKFAPERYAQWSLNEKVALELASAAAISGSYSLCAMKQVGLNIAADPLFSTAYTGVTGALVLVSADDPGPYSSQTEQDSRMYAYSAKIPVFDPASPEDAFRLTKKAFAMSRKYGVPVMLRPVMRVCHSRTSFEISGNPEGPVKGKFVKNTERWAATPKFRAKLHRELTDKLKLIALEESENIKIQKNNDAVIITSGYPYAVCSDVMKDIDPKADIIKIDMPYPVSVELIRDIEKNYSRILVLEETFPLLEDCFSDGGKVSGKRDGTVISAGEFTADKCMESLEKFMEIRLKNKEEKTGPIETEPPAKPRLCPGCGHRSAFFAIKRAFPMGIFPGDIGCYTLGTNLKAVDTCICMGASVTFAESLKRENPDKPVIAAIGDSTFFHTGIPALLNAKINDAPIVIAILDNSTTAMTGFQPVPHAQGKISMEKVIEGLGINFIKICDPYEIKKSAVLIKEASAYAESEKTPSVVIFRRSCVTQHREIFAAAPEITNGCTDCGICYETFECPAITGGDGKAVIDPAFCNGCMCCLQVCPHHAIKEGEE